MGSSRQANFDLTVGSAEFWERASSDIAAARKRVLIQAMTFEGDAAGQGVAGAVMASPAADRRILVDDYTRHVVNDTFLALSRNRNLHDEARATWALFDAIIASGADLRITNPIGRNPLRYATRNHKKLLVIDDAVWIGGINFSDHNFEWHDMMMRIECPNVSDWLAGEFERDWTGRTATSSTRIGDVDLLSLDGSANETGFGPVLDLIESARHSIEVVSAYPTFPFVDALAGAAARGLPVRLYTPRPNNKPVIRDYLLGAARGAGLDIRLTPMMTHAKALLVDNEALVIGSSNFDFVSHRANAEYVATIRDPAVIETFAARLLEPLREGAGAPQPGDHSPWRSWKARTALRIADVLVSFLDHGPRVAEWRRP